MLKMATLYLGVLDAHYATAPIIMGLRLETLPISWPWASRTPVYVVISAAKESGITLHTSCTGFLNSDQQTDGEIFV